jgi:protein tyrosine phosphatase (PTP) superfamily phosphohydrolase (DUF442 family)
MRTFSRIAALAFLLQAGAILNAAEPPLQPVPMVSTNLQNAFRLSDKLYSGSAPENDSGFAELKRMGIKTILSVDGMPPDAQKAREFGMKYIHIPIGYDGIKEAEAIKILKAAETAPGPIYVHCHHGKHRGPAAVAIICKGEAAWHKQDALNWLKQAGTSTEFPGLFESALFSRPAEAVMRSAPSVFPERVEPQGLVAAMIQADEYWAAAQSQAENPHAAKANTGSKTLAELAKLSAEEFREMQRLPESKDLGNRFLNELKNMEQLFNQGREALKAGHNGGEWPAGLTRQITESCSKCHARYRN